MIIFNVIRIIPVMNINSKKGINIIMGIHSWARMSFIIRINPFIIMNSSDIYYFDRELFNSPDQNFVIPFTKRQGYSILQNQTFTKAFFHNFIKAWLFN